MGWATLSDRISQSVFRRYAAALAVTLVALLVRRALQPFLGDTLPYLTLLPAVTFSAWFCGVGPAALAVFAGLAGARYFFMAPEHSLGVASAAQAIGAAVYLAACAVIVAIGEESHRVAEAHREALGDMEGRVALRTAELDEAVEREVTAALQCAPSAISGAKKLIRYVSTHDAHENLDYTATALADCWESAELREGIDAFYHKRKPNWQP